MTEDRISRCSRPSKPLNTAQIIKKLARARRRRSGLTIRDQRDLFWQGLFEILERESGKQVC